MGTKKQIDKDINVRSKMIDEMAQDIEDAMKVAGEWLMAETKRILQEKGAFHSAEHTKTIHEIVAEELTKKGYSKSVAEDSKKEVREALTKVLGFCAEDEVGMKYLIKLTAKEYGVEL